MPSSPKVLYVLACGCIGMGAATGVFRLNCPEHGSQRVTDVHVYEWRARCKTPRCTVSRWAGMSKDTANRIATRHALGHPTHLLTVEYVRNPFATRVREILIRNAVILLS